MVSGIATGLGEQSSHSLYSLSGCTADFNGHVDCHGKLLSFEVF
jgi:hypothetical protein